MKKELSMIDAILIVLGFCLIFCSLVIWNAEPLVYGIFSIIIGGLDFNKILK